LLMVGLFREKSTVGWWLISQAKDILFSLVSNRYFHILFIYNRDILTLSSTVIYLHALLGLWQSVKNPTTWTLCRHVFLI
jgi:hypothetical protein